MACVQDPNDQGDLPAHKKTGLWGRWAGALAEPQSCHGVSGQPVQGMPPNPCVTAAEAVLVTPLAAAPAVPDADGGTKPAAASLPKKWLGRNHFTGDYCALGGT